MISKLVDGAMIDIEKACIAAETLSDDVFYEIIATGIHSNSQIKVHMLKIQEEYLNALKAGIKTFEIRLNDRDFNVSDILLLHEEGSKQCYMCSVTYITQYAQKENYVVMSVVPIHARNTMTLEQDIVMYNYIKELNKKRS